MVARTWRTNSACVNPAALVAEPALVAGFLFVFVDMLHKLDFLD